MQPKDSPKQLYRDACSFYRWLAYARRNPGQRYRLDARGNAVPSKEKGK
jgi:hypothetical protein